MSFILDALKKSQAEQQDQLAALAYQQQMQRSGLNPWLTGLLIVVLVSNAAVLAWVLLVRDEAAPTAVEQKPASIKPDMPESQQPTQIAKPGAEPEDTAAPSTPPPTRIAVPPRTPTPTSNTRPIVIGPSGSAINNSSIQVDPVSPAPVQTTAPSLDNLIPLQQLPTAQQQRYLALEYSIHIFHTDAPQESMVIINGERTRIGDRVAGLVLAAITETEVIYAETTPDGTRHVIVPVVDDLGQ